MKWIYVEGTQTIHKWVWAKSIEKNPTWTHTHNFENEKFIYEFLVSRSGVVLVHIYS